MSIKSFRFGKWWSHGATLRTSSQFFQMMAFELIDKSDAKSSGDAFFDTSEADFGAQSFRFTNIDC